jgi:hypothetical protein
LYHIGYVIVNPRSQKDDTVCHEPREDVDFPEGHLTFFNDRPSHVVGFVVCVGNEIPYRLAVEPAILGCELDKFIAISHAPKLRHKCF